MQLGIQTRPWGREMNRHNLAGILAEAAATGYHGFEIGAKHLNLDNPAWLKQLAASHKLQVVGIHLVGEPYDLAKTEWNLPDLERAITFAAAVGAAFVPFSSRFKEHKTEAELNQQADSLNRIGRLCRVHGLVLCYHNHNWEIEQACAELHHLCDRTDPALVSLCLDVGWVERAGGSPVAVAESFFDRIGYFHLKDTTAEVWREVGYGQVDFEALFPLIRRRQDWWLVVEQDDTERPPAESARLSRNYLKQHLGV